MLKHLQIFPLMVGIVIGVIGVMFVRPEENVTRKYPTPTDQGKTIYKDKNGTCYHYLSKEVDCDKNEGKLKPYPLSL